MVIAAQRSVALLDERQLLAEDLHFHIQQGKPPFQAFVDSTALCHTCLRLCLQPLKDYHDRQTAFICV